MRFQDLGKDQRAAVWRYMHYQNQTTCGYTFAIQCKRADPPLCTLFDYSADADGLLQQGDGFMSSIPHPSTMTTGEALERYVAINPHYGDVETVVKEAGIKVERFQQIASDEELPTLEEVRSLQSVLGGASMRTFLSSKTEAVISAGLREEEKKRQEKEKADRVAASWCTKAHKLMKKRRITKTDVAAATGISRYRVSVLLDTDAYEKLPTSDEAREIARLLGTTVSELFRADEIDDTPPQKRTSPFYVDEQDKERREFIRKQAFTTASIPDEIKVVLYEEFLDRKERWRDFFYEMLQVNSSVDHIEEVVCDEEGRVHVTRRKSM